MSSRGFSLQGQRNQRQAQKQPGTQQDGKKFLPPGPNITSNAYFYTQNYEHKWLHTANLCRAARNSDISLNDVKAITFMVKNYLFGLYAVSYTHLTLPTTSRV